ncbi:MAG: AAA family ATPase [Betaproteobacteria bacterium]|nr:AAA family ATPase [Betaproteobacteria bacterium]
MSTASRSPAAAVRSLQDHATLVAALRAPGCFPHAVSRIDVVETHISSVILTGKYAYKIKKPVNLGFLDFSTLAARRRFCDDELRLNGRTAPGLYLNVVAISGTPENPVLAAPGPAIEYAVRMRQFAPQDTLDCVLRRHELDAACIDGLAATVAAFHGSIAVAPPEGPFGDPATVQAAARDNFAHIERLVPRPEARAPLAELRRWTESEFARAQPDFASRRAEGCVRECHSDLHLGNVALVDGDPVPFDCIEFNDAFRWIDVMSEVAFMVMDLVDHRERAFAFRFLNRYLEATGDYAGIAVLRFYLVYRAMVRAKIALIRARQPDHSAEVSRQSLEAFDEYLRLAAMLARGAAPALILTCGLSGSGKTSASQLALESIGAVRLRSDIERKRLHGLGAAARTASAPNAGLYAPQSTQATYARMADLARTMLPAGFPVIVDATFSRRTERRIFRDLARAQGGQFLILACEAPAEVLEERIVARARSGADPSEATLEVLEKQIAARDPLDTEEQAAAIVCDTTDAARLAAGLAALRWRALLERQYTPAAAT